MKKEFKNIIFLILLSFTKSLFSKEKIITEINNIDKLIEKLEYENRFSLILIYSTSNLNSQKFKTDYIKLSYKYNKIVSFYSINGNKCNYEKIFKIASYPSIFYFNKGEFIFHYGLNNYDTISNKIENNYFNKCELLSFNQIIEFKNNFNKTNYKNYVIGYFDNENLKIKFLNIIYKFIGYIDKCFYYNEKEKNKNNFIIGYNKQRAKFFNLTISEKNFEENLNYYINNQVINIYEEINEQKFSSLLESQDRFFILFSYKNKIEREKFINKSIELDSFEIENKIRPFNIILVNYKNYLNEKFSIKNSGIFLVENTLKNFTQIDNITIIYDLIKNISLNFKSNFEKGQNYIGKYLYNMNKEDEISYLILFLIIISVFLFSISIFIIYHQKYFEKEEKKESDKSNNNEKEEISQLNELSSIDN